MLDLQLCTEPFPVPHTEGSPLLSLFAVTSPPPSFQLTLATLSLHNASPFLILRVFTQWTPSLDLVSEFSTSTPDQSLAETEVPPPRL